MATPKEQIIRNLEVVNQLIENLNEADREEIRRKLEQSLLTISPDISFANNSVPQAPEAPSVMEIPSVPEAPVAPNAPIAPLPPAFTETPETGGSGLADLLKAKVGKLKKPRESLKRKNSEQNLTTAGPTITDDALKGVKLRKHTPTGTPVKPQVAVGVGGNLAQMAMQKKLERDNRQQTGIARVALQKTPYKKPVSLELFAKKSDVQNNYFEQNKITDRAEREKVLKHWQDEFAKEQASRPQTPKLNISAKVAGAKPTQPSAIKSPNAVATSSQPLLSQTASQQLKTDDDFVTGIGRERSVATPSQTPAFGAQQTASKAAEKTKAPPLPPIPTKPGTSNKK